MPYPKANRLLSPGAAYGSLPNGGVPTTAISTQLAWYLFAGGIALYMMLSASTLLHFGIGYDTADSPIAAKIHPATWLVLLSFGILIAKRGNPLKIGFQSVLAEPLLGVYLFCISSMLLWLAIRHAGRGALNVVDTLIMPFVCVATVRMFDARSRYRLLVLMLTLLVGNTLIGIVESMLQKSMLPLEVPGTDEVVVEEFFRPTALLGHPLTNALVTAALLPAALYLRVSMFLRIVLMLLLWVGALAFGGRTAFLLATVGYGAYFFGRLTMMLVRGRFSYVQITGATLAAMIGGTAVVAGIAVTGVGERIIKSFGWDNSASVRLQIWNVFDYVRGWDLVFGISPAEVLAVGDRIGLGKTEAIENFWLVFLLLNGWVGYLPFLVAMACLIAWLLKSTRGAMRVAVILFFATASSTNSLATKTAMLVLFMTVVAITRRQPLPE